MQIQRIQYTYPNTNINLQKNKYYTEKPLNLNTTKVTSSDYFVKTKNNQKQQIQFQGNALQELIIKYLKNRSYSNSMRGSKWPYLSIDPDLAGIIKKIDIKVSKNETIEAYDINPKNSNQYVIFLHGFSQNITNNQPLYKSLLDTNYGILAIDYRGYGKSQIKKPSTETEIMHDIQAATKYLNNKGINNIGLVGHSFGSYMAAKTSNLNPFKFQILVSPMLSLEFWLKNVLKNPQKYKMESTLIKYIPGFKEQYFKVFEINKHIVENTTPTYIIHSKTDRYISSSGVNKLAEITPNKKDYILLPKGGHRMDQNKIDSITEVLKKL